MCVYNVMRIGTLQSWQYSKYNDVHDYTVYDHIGVAMSQGTLKKKFN